MDRIPDPDRSNPTIRQDLTNVVFLKNGVTSPLVDVGNYTYYDNEGYRAPFE